MGIVDECKKILKNKNGNININVYNMNGHLVITYLNGLKKMNIVRNKKDDQFDYVEVFGSSINKEDSHYLDYSHKFVSLKKWLKKYNEPSYDMYSIYISRVGVIIDSKNYIYDNRIINIIKDTMSLINTYSGTIMVNGREKEMVDAYHDFINNKDIVSYRDVLSNEISVMELQC